MPVELRQGDPWAPWQALPTASDLHDITERAIAFGVLAPNVQNMQPRIAKRHNADALIV